MTEHEHDTLLRIERVSLHNHKMLHVVFNAISELISPEDQKALKEAASGLVNESTQLTAALDAAHRPSPPSSPVTLPFQENVVANPIVQATIDAITNAKSVEESAVAFVNGVPAMITDAVNKALANGATADELAPLTDLATALTTDSAALTVAMQANTPVTPQQFKAKK